ncbi:MAG: 30S ribosomal protein S6 [Mariprofundales bacterium]|nr:30S ribosomal protein S6 [Mariprofundales bacterium]
MYYETVFIVNPDASQENTEKLTDELVAKVEAAGGRIVKRENWGVRPLAYPIAKRKRGHYLLLVTDGEAAAVAVLEQAIKLEERIIRFLTTRLTKLSDQPSPILRRRSERAQREAEAANEAADAEEAAQLQAAEVESAAAKQPADPAPVESAEVTAPADS